MKLTSFCVAVVVLSLVGCVPKKSPQVVAPVAPVAPVASGLPDLATAIPTLVRDLESQIGRSSPERTLVVDPLVDHAGQQTLGTRRVQQELASAIPSGLGGIAVVDFTPETVDKAEFVATGTVEREVDLDGAVIPGVYKLSFSLTDRRSRLVIAHTVTRFKQEDLDTTPTPFYAESPSNAIDRSTAGYMATSKTAKGLTADEVYLDQLPTGALISTALNIEEAGRYEEALEYYTRASARPDGQTSRTFQGLYLCNLHLRRMPAAEAAFRQLVDLGIATNKLAVKLLFRPGLTTFVEGPSANGVYPMWLRQISSAAVAARACMVVVGHSSRTGTAEYNYALSMKRATAVQTSLVPALRGNTCAEGRGFDENIIGIGTDDARDALDRRVEFQVVPCEELKCERK